MPAWTGRPWCCSHEDGDLTLARRLAAGGRARHRQHDRGALGLHARRSRPASRPRRLPIVPWLFLPLRTPRGRVGVIGIAQARRAAARLGGAHAARHARRTDRGGAGTRLAGARDGQRARVRRDRARAQHAAGFDLPRFPHAAGLDPRLGHQPARLWRQARRLPRASDLLGQIKQEAESLDEMVRNLLAITRIDAGALELRRDWIDLARDRGARRQRRPAPRRRAQDRQSSCPPTCRWCGPTRRLLEQAIGNVIGNAIAHTPDETRVIGAGSGNAVRLFRCPSPTMAPALQPKLLPHVFDKFVACAQATDASRRRRRHRAWPGHRQGHHGSAWRLDRSRKPGHRRRAARGSS